MTLRSIEAIVDDMIMNGDGQTILHTILYSSTTEII